MKKKIKVSLVRLLQKGKYSTVRAILRSGQKITLDLGFLGRSGKAAVDFVYDVNETDYVGTSALLYALMEKKEDIALELIRQGADIEVENIYNQTVIGICAECNLCKVLKLVLDSRSKEVNRETLSRKVGQWGGTFLYKAIFQKNHKAAELLLQAGADPNAIDNRNKPIMLEPIIANDVRMVRLLLKYGANPELHICPRLNLFSSSLAFKYPQGYAVSRLLLKAIPKDEGYQKRMRAAYRKALNKYKNAVMAAEIKKVLE